MTIRLQELRKQEREDLVLLVECLYGLAATRENLIEAEQERAALLTEDAVKTENALEDIHARLDEACRGLAMGGDSSAAVMVDRLINSSRRKDALLEQIEPVCNRLAAFVAEELGHTPENFEDALDRLLARVRMLATMARSEGP